MARRDRDFDYDDPLAVPGRWKRWLIRLGIVGALLVVLYFFLSSSFVLRRVVLPRLAASLNGSVSVGTISLSPFSRLHVTDVKVHSAAGETVLSADELEVRYGLVSLLRGRWLIPEIRLAAPVVKLVRLPDGTTTLDALIKSDQPRRGQPMRLPETLLIGRVTVTDGALDYEQQLENGERTRVLLQGLNLELTNLGNQRKAALKLTTALGLQRRAPANDGRSSGQIAFDLRSTATVQLSKKLRLEGVTIASRLTTRQAAGSYAKLAGLTGILDGEFGQRSVRKCELRFERGGASLGQLSLSGPLDLNRMNLRLRAQLKGLSHEILDLLGSPFGVTFGNAQLDGETLVDLADNGKVINSRIVLRASQVGIRTPRGAAPVLDLALNLDGRVQLPMQSADIRAFTLTVTNQGRQLLRLHAPKAINLLWNQGIRPSINQSELFVKLDQLDLARWRPVFGPAVSAGRLSIQGVVTNQDDGRRIRAWFTNQVEGLTFQAGDYGLTNATVRLETMILFKDFLSLSAEEARLKLALDGVPVAELKGTASYEFGNDEWRGQFEGRANASNLVAHFPNPWVEARRGRFRMDGSLRFLGQARMLSVSALLDDFAGRLERYQFDGQRLQVDCSVDWTPELVSLRQVGLTSGRGAGQSGSVYVGGQYRPGTGEGRYDLSLVNLTPAALGPFLAPHVADFEFADGTLDGEVQVRITPTGRRECNAQLETKHLVLRDRHSGRRHFPLDLKAEIALIESDGLVELLTNVVSLPATKQAANRIHATGRLNLSPTNHEPGQLTIHADALDLTRLADYYRTNRAPATAEASGETSSPPMDSPAPSAAPTPEIAPAFPDFVAELTVDKLVVHQFVATDGLARALLTNSVLRLDPCRMKVGGGRFSLQGVRPLSGTPPGDFQLVADHLPIEPITMAFLGSPRGRYVGELNANLAYRSLAGNSAATAPTGRFQLGLTNLTFRILPQWTRSLLAPAAALLRADQLLRSPLRYLGVQATLAGDTLDLRDFSAAGDLFLLSTKGRVKLADDWRSSAVHLPVTLALPDNLAGQLGLKNLSAAARPGFVELPPFLTLEGTLGNRTNKVETARLSGLLAGALGRTLGGDAGNALETIGNLLQGGGGRKTPATNRALPFLPGLLNPPKTDPN